MHESRPLPRTRWLLTLVVTAVAITGLVSVVLQPKASAITNGDRPTENYSFIAALKRSPDGRSFCTAVLVDVLWLATARHCVAGRDPSKLIISIGTNNQDTGGSIIYGTQIVTPRRGDFALVKLAAPVPHQPIGIADSAPVGGDVRLLGFGITCPVRGCGPTVKQLRQLDTKIGADSDCRGRISSRNEEIEVCMLHVTKGAKGACAGDSGGPAVIREGSEFLLVGVTNRGTAGSPCGTRPTVYGDVTAHKKFVLDTIGSTDSTGSTGSTGTPQGTTPESSPPAADQPESPSPNT